MCKRLLVSYSVVLICVFNSCAPKPYSGTNKMYKKQTAAFAKKIKQMPVLSDTLKPSSSTAYTTNFGMRKPDIVVIHYTAQNSCEQTLKTFTKPATQVSAHYVICKDGTLHHMLNDYLRAWHAGIGKWGNNTDVNSSSIGIEIDNNAVDSFSIMQLNTLYSLLSFLKKEYNIPAANFIGHSDIAPGRKIDPGILFPWKALSDNGFGLWYNDTTSIVVPPDFNVVHALKIIGYDVKNVQNAIGSFKLHYLNTTSNAALTKEKEKVLYAVMRRVLN